MNKFILALILSCVIPLAAYAAEDNDYNTETERVESLEEKAARLNVITPEQYIEASTPVVEEAHKISKSLTEKEAKMMISIQNRINRQLAKRNNEPQPAKIEIDPKDSKALEEMIAPNIYTYDDVPANF